MDKVTAIRKIKCHASELTNQQYKVIIGLVKSGDVDGAIKGLHKILRRNKKI